MEPFGENVAYRRRHALAFTARQPRSQEPHKNGCQNKRINYSKSDANQRRVLANILPNRMALYVGICNDRYQRRLENPETYIIKFKSENQLINYSTCRYSPLVSTVSVTNLSPGSFPEGTDSFVLYPKEACH